MSNGKLKAFINDTKAGKIIKSVVIGAVKATPFGNVITELQDNTADELTGAGNTNVTRATTYAFVGVLVLGRIFFPEHINAELFNKILDIFV